MATRYVLFYESADNVSERAGPHAGAHRARLQEFHDRGDLVAVGTFANPQDDGAMAIFVSREAAEEFVGDDPFVVHGVVRSWRIVEWHDLFA